MIGAVLKQAETLLETMQVAHAGPRHVGLVLLDQRFHVVVADHVALAAPLAEDVQHAVHISARRSSVFTPSSRRIRQVCGVSDNASSVATTKTHCASLTACRTSILERDKVRCGSTQPST